MKMEDEKAFKLDMVSVRLVKDAPIFSDKPITTPSKAAKLMGKYLSEMDREVVCLINLKQDSTPINCHILSIGSLVGSIVSPRELFKTSILSNAANIVLMHSHPSGNITPSRQDINITVNLAKLCEMMGMPLLDHIIVGGGNEKYYSFREKDMMPNVNSFLRDIISESQVLQSKVAEDEWER